MSEEIPFLLHSENVEYIEKAPTLKAQKRAKLFTFKALSTLSGMLLVSLIMNLILAWCLARASQAVQKCKLPLSTSQGRSSNERNLLTLWWM